MTYHGRDSARGLPSISSRVTVAFAMSVFRVRNVSWAVVLVLSACGGDASQAEVDGRPTSDGGGSRFDDSGAAGSEDFSDSAAPPLDGSSPDLDGSTSSDAGVEEEREGANAGRPKTVTLCYTKESSEHPAVKAYWEAARNGDLATRAQVIADLEAAVAEHPDQEELVLLLGLASLWRVAESYVLDSLNPFILLESVTRAESALVKAYELCPTDHRIPAWLGPIRIRMGRMLGDDAMVQAGFDILQQGLDHYPSFVLFSKFLVLADLPADDPEFLGAVQAVRDNGDYCGTPDTMLSSDPACRDHYRAARNVEGSGVFLGDMYAKAQDKAAALNAYGWAKKMPDYDTWPFKAVLEERIKTVDQRIKGASTLNDPFDDMQPAWESAIQCALCHQQ